MKKKYVVYKIKSNIDDRYYVGSTQEYLKRKNRHFKELIKGVHHCIHLQRAFKKYGLGAFEFEIVAEFSSREGMLEYEQVLLDSSDNLFNTGKNACGGDTITNNPNYASIVQRHRENYYRNPIPKNDVSGENNPNYKDGSSMYKPCSRCGITRKTVGTGMCASCMFETRDISGQKNPFYGRSHSEETKKKLSESLKNRPKPPNSKRVRVGEDIFLSATEAARVLGCTPSTVLNRCKSSKFVNYEVLKV